MSPREITSTFRDEKNKKENAPIMLYELYVTEGVVMRFAEYDEDVVYNTQTYSKSAITHEGISTNLFGEVDTVRIKLGNVNREIGALMESYDGLREKKVKMMIVFSDQLGDANANISDIFYIDESEPAEVDAEIICSTKLDVYNVDCPLQTVERDFCEWEYKKEGCWRWNGSIWEAPSGFANEAYECNHTLGDGGGCKYHNNSQRFCGAPALPARELYVV